MRRLKDNISSEYVNAANRLNGKKARKKIVAYVESYDDIFFWRTVLSEFEDDKIYFEVMLPSRQNLTKGKKSALMSLLGSKVGDSMIACVDADYDYLLQGTTALSKHLNENPYVFHTYVYAIENYQCYAPSLHDVSVAVALNDHVIFDFEEYLRQYSEIIFPLFVWNIWFYRQNSYGKFTISDFNKVIEIGNFSLGNPYRGINNLRHKVGRKVQQFQRDYPTAKDSWLILKDELKQLGVTPQTTYLFIQGHHLFDNVVVPILNKVCEVLIRERQQEINHKAVHVTQRYNELASYSHSVEDVIPMLRRNTGYRHSEPFIRLQSDVRHFLQSRNQQSPEEHQSH